MTDVSTKPTPEGLPLPEPARVEWVPDDILPGSILTAYYTADQMLREREAYAAAKTAELQAKVTRYEESTRLAEAHLTLTLAQLAEAQAECARLRAAYLQQSKDFGYELRDPNGTIWDECRRLQAALDAALRGKESK